MGRAGRADWGTQTLPRWERDGTILTMVEFIKILKLYNKIKTYPLYTTLQLS